MSVEVPSSSRCEGTVRARVRLFPSVAPEMTHKIASEVELLATQGAGENSDAFPTKETIDICVGGRVC